MAKAPSTPENTWTDIAIVNSTKKDKYGNPATDKNGNPLTYRIQVNGGGKRRCTCMAYVFSGKDKYTGIIDPTRKGCKHLDKYKGLENDAKHLMPSDAAAACWSKAAEMLEDLLTVGMTYVNPASKSKMAFRLAEHLSKYEPVPVPVAAAGGRMFVFDED